MSRDLPKHITKTKSGFHVRMTINGKYHAKHFVEDNFESREKALQAAKEKRKEFDEIRKKKGKPKPKDYDTRFLYENPDNSTGIIGVFYKEEESKKQEKYIPIFVQRLWPKRESPKATDGV